MKLPQLRRLLAEDFKDQKSWIRPMFQILNTFMESIVNGLNKTLTIADNMAGDIKTVTISSAPTVSSPVVLSWTQSMPPKSIHVGNITGSTVSAAVGLTWTTATDGSIQITSLFGTTYPATVTLVIFAG